jgi:MYXO-CTERM domain-containing protein
MGIDARVSADLDFIGEQVCVGDGACVPSCGTFPLAEDPDCTAGDAAAMDAESSDGRGAVDGARADAEPATADAAHRDDATGPSGSNASDGCGCRLTSARGPWSHVAGFVMAIACIVWRRRRRRS